jgi:hypothetical protein
MQLACSILRASPCRGLNNLRMNHMKTKGPPFSITWNLEASFIEICVEIPGLSTNFTELGSTDICA